MSSMYEPHCFYCHSEKARLTCDIAGESHYFCSTKCAGDAALDAARARAKAIRRTSMEDMMADHMAARQGYNPNW